MRMRVRHAESVDRVAFEIEFDQHSRLTADDVTVVTGGDGNDRRGSINLDASVRVFDVDAALHQKADVRVHAVIGTDVRFGIPGPSIACRVDHALDAPRTGLPRFDAHAPDIAPH